MSYNAMDVGLRLIKLSRPYNFPISKKFLCSTDISKPMEEHSVAMFVDMEAESPSEIFIKIKVYQPEIHQKARTDYFCVAPDDVADVLADPIGLQVVLTIGLAAQVNFNAVHEWRAAVNKSHPL